MKKSTKLATLAVSSLLAFSTTANANPFTAKSNAQTPAQSAKSDAKCGEGKCGEGKCGGKATDKKKLKKADGKCGEGKCGGAKHHAKKSDAKCGEGKCGEGKCGAKK